MSAPQALGVPSGFRSYRESERRRIIIALTLVGSDLISGSAAFSLTDWLLGLSWAGTAITALPILIGFFCISGLYHGYGPTPFERLRSRLFGIIAFTVTFLVICGEALQSPNVWFAAACQGILVFLLGYYAEVLARHVLIRRKLWGAKTAFAGSGTATEQAHRLFSATPELGLRPVGRLSTGVGSPAKSDENELPVLGLVDELARMDHLEIEFIVADTEADFKRVSNAARLAACPPRVLLLQTDPRPGKPMLEPGTINLAVGRDPNTPRNRLAKRMIDFAVAIPALLLVLPLIGVLALAIKLSSPGPAFYAQARVGSKNRSLRVLKLRTMHCDAEVRLEHHLRNNAAARLEWDRFCKLSHDPRVLPYIGNSIRRMSLDELPQLWQVVRGEMSVVGPRPFPAYHTGRFDPEFQALRASVAQGLTGLWQVASRSNGDLNTQKVQDLYYIRNWSIWLDVYILLQTIPVVMGARGAR